MKPLTFGEQRPEPEPVAKKSQRSANEGGHEIEIDACKILYAEPESAESESIPGVAAYNGPLVCPGLFDHEQAFMKGKVTWFPQTGSYSHK